MTISKGVATRIANKQRDPTRFYSDKRRMRREEGNIQLHPLKKGESELRIVKQIAEQDDGVQIVLKGTIGNKREGGREPGEDESRLVRHCESDRARRRPLGDTATTRSVGD